MRLNLGVAFALLTAALAPAVIHAQPLPIVSVGAPAINCVFATPCTVTVTDFTAPLLGSGFLQSRTYQGQPGAPAAGLSGYEYRIDLTHATPGTSVSALTVDFGPVVGTLDYNGDGRPDPVFVVTRGGVGAVGPSSAFRAGRMVTFRFAPAVRAGQTSFFFGLASRSGPRPVRMQVETSVNPHTVLEARAPLAGSTPPAGPVAAEDCLPYDPARLTIRDERAQGWLLTDGRSRMLMLDNRADANRALAVARRHTAQCFIGRNNHRPDRIRYIVHYWRGNPGAVAAPGDDCLGYNPATVNVFDRGAIGWRMEDGAHAMLLFDNQADANRGLIVARANHNLCFIGRGNSRPNRFDYIVEYWR